MLALFAFFYLHKLFQCEAISVISAVETADVKCRNERQIYLPVEEFTSEACARCYKYMPTTAFNFKLHYSRDSPGTLYDSRTNQTHYVDPFNVSSVLLETFVEESYARKWLSCCREARKCCEVMRNTPPWSEDTEHCPRTWDGWQCWLDTQAPSTALMPCQEHIYFENGPPSCTKYASKECLPNGTWYTNAQLREWTNYSTCGRREVHTISSSYILAAILSMC